MIHSILYLLRGGIPWRFLPKHFGPWQTVYGTFRHWKATHLWESLNDRLRAMVRPVNWSTAAFK